jgi:hypothetical protein
MEKENLLSVREEVKQSLSILSKASLFYSLSFSSELNLTIQKKLSEVEKKGKGEKETLDNSTFKKKIENVSAGEEDEEEEASKQLARTYMTTRQYQRVAAILSTSKSLESRFLSLYSSFLLGERMREESTQRKGEGSGEVSSVTSNPHLPHLRADLHKISLSPSRGVWFGLLLYLYGVVLRNMGDVEEARKGTCHLGGKETRVWSQIWICEVVNLDEKNFVSLLIPKSFSSVSYFHLSLPM